VAHGERQYRDWRQRRDAALASGKVPSLQVTTTTQWAARVASRDSGFGVQELDVDVITLETAPVRPNGARFGTLVHAVLSVIALDADAATVGAVAHTQGRIVSASVEEVESAATAVRAVLAHPLIGEARRAQQAGRCLRETPVAIVVDGELVEGVADFAFGDDEGMTVIDFKTDRAEGDALSQYRRQVGLYARAVTRATGRPARAVLMQI
jgi:ATP-dependent exoDNAse (exonuclease V) beta subunit